MDERTHVVGLIAFWQHCLDRLIDGVERLTPENRQRVTDLATMTQARLRAYEERLEALDAEHVH